MSREMELISGADVVKQSGRREDGSRKRETTIALRGPLERFCAKYPRLEPCALMSARTGLCGGVPGNRYPYHDSKRAKLAMAG